MKLKKIISLILVITMICQIGFANVLTTFADGDMTLTVQADDGTRNLTIGETNQVDLFLKDISTPVAGFQFDFIYDSGEISNISVSSDLTELSYKISDGVVKFICFDVSSGGLSELTADTLIASITFDVADTVLPADAAPTIAGFLASSTVPDNIPCTIDDTLNYIEAPAASEISLELTADEASYEVGDPVFVNLAVNGITTVTSGIEAISFDVTYDPAVFEFDGATDVASGFIVYDGGPGVIKVIYFDYDSPALTADVATAATLNFTAIADAADSEIATENGLASDSDIAPVMVIDDSILVTVEEILPPGTVKLDVIADETELEVGTDFSVDISLTNVDNVEDGLEALQFDVIYDPDVFEYVSAEALAPGVKINKVSDGVLRVVYFDSESVLTADLPVVLTLTFTPIDESDATDIEIANSFASDTLLNSVTVIEGSETFEVTGTDWLIRYEGLSDPLMVADKDDVDQLVEDYDDLTPEQKTLYAGEYADLLDKQTMLEDRKEAIDDAEALFDALADSDTYNVMSDLTDLEEALDAYEALTTPDTNDPYCDALTDLYEEYEPVYSAIIARQAELDELKDELDEYDLDEITLADKDALEELAEKYAEITDPNEIAYLNQGEDRVEKLEDLLAAIAAGEAWDAAFDALANPLYVSHLTDVNKLVTDYGNLPAGIQGEFTAEKAAVDAAKTMLDTRKAAIDSVKALFEDAGFPALGDVVVNMSDADITAVEAALAAYEALSALDKADPYCMDVKALYDDYDEALDEVIARRAELDDLKDDIMAQDPDEVDDDNEEEVRDLVDAYDDLTADEKDYLETEFPGTEEQVEDLRDALDALIPAVTMKPGEPGDVGTGSITGIDPETLADPDDLFDVSRGGRVEIWFGDRSAQAGTSDSVGTAMWLYVYNKKNVKVSEYAFVITGDAAVSSNGNGDGAVSGADITAVADMLTGKTPPLTGSFLAAADCDGDTVITLFDLIDIVDISLG